MKRESRKLSKSEVTDNLKLVTEWLEFILSKIKNGEAINDGALDTAERVVRAHGIRGTQWLDILKK
jgi:hypothetical protein